MCYPPKLAFFIKNAPLNRNLHGIVPLNYHFSKQKCPLKLHNFSIYICVCCPPIQPFFIKNLPLNLTICYIYLYVLILFANTLTSNKLSYTPPYFYPMSGHLFLTIICVQEGHTPLVSQVLDII